MSSGNYADDRKFGDSFMNEVKAILGQFLLKDDFTDEDRERNTDLIVLKMDTKRIGVIFVLNERAAQKQSLKKSWKGGATISFMVLQINLGRIYLNGLSVILKNLDIICTEL